MGIGLIIPFYIRQCTNIEYTIYYSPKREKLIIG